MNPLDDPAQAFIKGYDGLTSETPDKKAEKAPLVPKEGSLTVQMTSENQTCTHGD